MFRFNLTAQYELKQLNQKCFAHVICAYEIEDFKRIFQKFSLVKNISFDVSGRRVIICSSKVIVFEL